jgi:protein disulfide-isomerase
VASTNATSAPVPIVITKASVAAATNQPMVVTQNLASPPRVQRITVLHAPGRCCKTLARPCGLHLNFISFYLVTMNLFLITPLIVATVLLTAPPSTNAAAAWMTDFSKAQAQAKAEGKAVLVNFTGSDWCGWCIRLRKEVFAKPEFDEYASSRLVLVEIDFPKHKALPEATKKANQVLAGKFGVEGFPTLMVLDADGKPLGKLGYTPGGSRPFLKALDATLPRKAAGTTVSARTPSGQPATSALKQEAANAKAAKPSGEASWRPSHADGLTLKGISGPKEKRMALVNNQTLAAGETASVKTPAGSLRVHCVEIRDGSVLVTIDGKQGQHELRLWNGL